ncbi:hypothetical protein [Halorientalis halophila]|uniref:hypothetical protein n=1 Tax=Halorientalis halophila TaxID=3108499 RepID=UPI0030099AC8
MDSNPFASLKSAGTDRLLSQFTPSQIPHVQHGSRVAAVLEHEQANALNRALDAAGMGEEQIRHDWQQRQAMLLQVADAVSNQQFRAWWFENVAPRIVENPEDAQALAGLDGDEWRETLEAWHASAYGRGLVETPPSEAGPRDLAQTAANVAENRFGVPLRVLVARVVAWDQAAETRQLLAGNIDHHTHLIRRLADHIEQQNERIEELEAQVDE